MGGTQINAHYDTGRDLAVITIMTADGKARSYECKAPSLDTLLSDLAKVRAQMKEEVPQFDSPERQVRGVHNPSWTIGITNWEGKPGVYPAITYRHPGFGWQGIVLSPAKARSLARELTKKADEIEPASR